MSAAEAASTDHARRDTLHFTEGSPVTSARTRSRGGSIMAPAGTTSAMTPRNTQCQLRDSATNPAIAGPMIDGMTHAAANPANTRARNAEG